MPSLRHELLARVVPRVRRSRELDSVDQERARLEHWHAGLDRSLPTSAIRRFEKRFTLEREDLGGAGGAGPGFASYTLARLGPDGARPRRTVVYLHGGGFVAPFDPVHLRYAARLATALDARVVLPDYPLAPEHTWRDSHDLLVDLVGRHTAHADDVVLAGDSAGGGLALAVALGLQRVGAAPPGRLLLHAPWGDLTTSTPETERVTLDDPWLFLGKLRAYAAWWAGSPDDLARPEVSPALAPLDELTTLPPTLMFSGTRDTLWPGCTLLAERATAARWDLTYVERPGLLHVYPLLPVIPEAAQAWRTTQAFLGAGAVGAR